LAPSACRHWRQDGGFADLYNPSTLPGRLVTVGLVLLGLTVTGIFTASLTSVLVEDESSRIEQAQHDLEAELGVINQKLDLLSGETNEGLIALETVSQALSNQETRADIAHILQHRRPKIPSDVASPGASRPNCCKKPTWLKPIWNRKPSPVPPYKAWP